MGSNSAAITLPWWKAALAAVVCVAVGVGAASMFTAPAGDGPSEAAAALERLRSATVEVTAVTHEAPLSAVTGSARPEVSDVVAGVSVGERAVIDFAAGDAAVTPPSSDVDGMAPDTGAAPRTALSVTSSGERIVANWQAVWGGFDLGDIADTWAIDGPLPTGVDMHISTVPTLLDLAAHAEEWSTPLVDAGAGVWRGTLEGDAVQRARTDRLDRLDGDLAELVSADLAVDAFVPPAGPWELTVTDGDVTVLRAEFLAGERIFTVSWFVEPTDAEPELLDADDPVDYLEFRAALDAATAPAGELLDDGAVAFPDDPGDKLTDDDAGDMFLPTDPSDVPPPPVPDPGN